MFPPQLLANTELCCMAFCREWSIIWGGVLMVFALVPTFRHFRVLNIIALVGTTYTAILIIILGIQKGFGESGVNL